MTLKSCIVFIVVTCLAGLNIMNAQMSFVYGTTYQERAQSLVNNMAHAEPVGNGKIKYVAPYYFARLLTGVDTDKAVKELSRLYRYQLGHKEEFYKSGSDMDFFAHTTMHGYMLTKDKMPDDLKALIREFMSMCRFIRKNVTLNMRMMTETSGFLCAEEWPDFIDADGNDAEKIKSTLHDGIVTVMRNFILNNCPEADAFTYLGTNLQYLRMLAEYAQDTEVRSTALCAYHHTVAQLLLPWNRGLYCANPARCKGWKNLYTNSLSKTQLPLLTWLLYGNPDERMIDAHASNSDNSGCFNFWIAYQRNVAPISMLSEIDRNKTFPYDFEALRVDDNHFDCRYTYQSDNYGLSTQTVEAFPGKYKRFQYTYAFKETKNLHLVWRSDKTDATVFSVCHDNPERPQHYQRKSNKIGYGENPYHRVFGYEKSAIGVYNVAEDYMETPVFYRMYVPFSNDGIKKRMVRKINGMTWVLCHTGSMMFAFATPEVWKFESPDGKFHLPGHDVLILKDNKCRRGSWVLETTEITDRYRSADGNAGTELDNFARDIKEKVSITLSDDYLTSDTPAITYTNIKGDTLGLTYFSPETPYDGQYKVNGQPRKINTEYLSKSRYMKQKAGSDVMTFYTPAGVRNIQLK